MSYKHSYSRQFFSDEFHVTYVPILKTSPERCPEHLDTVTGRSLGFRAISSIGLLRDDQGLWRLIQPLNIAIEMPGVKQKLTMLSVRGMHVIGWGTIGAQWEGKIGIEEDGAKVLPETPITTNKDSWAVNNITLSILLTGTELDIRLWQAVTTISGYIGLHNSLIILSGEYYTDIPPAKAMVTINVLNSDTNKPVSGALVILKSGPVVVAQKYTDGGVVVFNNIDEGAYTIKITASNYELFEMSISVIAPAVEYKASIVPIPVAPLPWWIIPAVVGTVGFGGVITLGSLVRRQPPVYVVK